MNNDTNLTDTDMAAAATFALSLSESVIQDCMASNNTLETMNIQPTTAKGSMAFYGTHYANAEIDSYGVAGIVREVLTEKPAILPRNVPDDMRAHAIQVAMFSHEIIELAKPKFAIAGLRYKAQAVKNVLSTYGTHEIGKIKLTTEEDTGRNGGKGRNKYYLIKKQQ